MKFFQQIVIFIAIWGSRLYAIPVVEKYEDIEIDWGRLRVRYASGVPVGTGEDASFENLEKKAVSQGILYLKDRIEKFHMSQLVGGQVDEKTAQISAELASKNVAKSTYVYQTDFFSEGNVTVFLENHLTKALLRGDLFFAKNESELDQAHFSGLVLRSRSYVAPRAFYQVVDETGKVVYEIKDVQKAGYEKNLMGRWFSQLSRDELLKYAGPKPLSIEFEANSKGQFVVLGNVWNQIVTSNAELLKNAKIVFEVGSQEL